MTLSGTRYEYASLAEGLVSLAEAAGGTPKWWRSFVLSEAQRSPYPLEDVLARMAWACAVARWPLKPGTSAHLFQWHE